MDIALTMAGVTIKLALVDVVIFAFSVVIALAGLVTGLLARRIWLIVEGELATSWGWVLPGFGIYIIASGLRVMSVYLANPNAKLLAVNIFNPVVGSGFLSWSIKAIPYFQSVFELLFLVFILLGLVRQYRLFSSLARGRA